MINYIFFKIKDMNFGLFLYEIRLISDWLIIFLIILIIIILGFIVI